MIFSLCLFSVECIPQRLCASDVRIRIDQFGYRPDDKKIGAISNPVVGFDAPDPYSPGPVLEVKTADGNQTVFAGSAVAWNQGSVHVQSGDQAWYFDFSALSAPGRYYVHDPANNADSHVFDISDDVYSDALKQAFRSLSNPGMRSYGDVLRQAALPRLENHRCQIPSSYDNNGFQSSSAEDSAYGQTANQTKRIWPTKTTSEAPTTSNAKKGDMVLFYHSDKNKEFETILPLNGA